MNRTDYARYAPTQVRSYRCPACGGDCTRCAVCDSTGAVRANRHDAHDWGFSAIAPTAKAPLLTADALWRWEAR